MWQLPAAAHLLTALADCFAHTKLGRRSAAAAAAAADSPWALATSAYDVSPIDADQLEDALVYADAGDEHAVHPLLLQSLTALLLALEPGCSLRWGRGGGKWAEYLMLIAFFSQQTLVAGRAAGDVQQAGGQGRGRSPLANEGWHPVSVCPLSVLAHRPDVNSPLCLFPRLLPVDQKLRIVHQLVEWRLLDAADTQPGGACHDALKVEVIEAAHLPLLTSLAGTGG